MSKAKKVLLIIGASLLTLLVISNSFFIYLLVSEKQADNSEPDYCFEMYTKRRNLLRYNKDAPADPVERKRLVEVTLKDVPNILYDEPIIFIANPDLKPLVAEILEEDPSILEKDPLILYYYPDLMEINPALEPMLEIILENTNDNYVKTLFEKKH